MSRSSISAKTDFEIMLRSTSILSWNINGKVSDKIPILTQLLKEYDIICLQEHFLSADKRELIKISSDCTVFFSPAKITAAYGRPSGGLAILTRLPCKLIEAGDHILEVSHLNTSIMNVYLPTNYRNEKSEAKFMGACKKLCKLIKKNAKSAVTRSILIGDFNFDLTDKTLPRSQLLWSSIPPSYSLVDKNESYTYVGPSSSTSNLDHVVSSFSIKQATVLREGYYSDHLPICATIECNVESKIPQEGKWFYVQEWSHVDRQLFMSECDTLLNKIKVPFHLLSSECRSYISEYEIEIQLTIYLAEINHALRCAEKCAVPSRRVRKKTEITDWSKNQSLVAACNSAKLWLRIWNESDKPRSGIINELRLKTKRKFTRALKDHKIMLIQKNVDKIASDPSLLWKSFKRSDRTSVGSIPEKSWIDYYKSEFSSPDLVAESKYEKELDRLLANSIRSAFIVTPSDIEFNLKKKLRKNLLPVLI